LGVEEITGKGNGAGGSGNDRDGSGHSQFKEKNEESPSHSAHARQQVGGDSTIAEEASSSDKR